MYGTVMITGNNERTEVLFHELQVNMMHVINQCTYVNSMLHDSDSAKTWLALDSSTWERLKKDPGQTRQIGKKLKYGHTKEALFIPML